MDDFLTGLGAIFMFALFANGTVLNEKLINANLGSTILLACRLSNDQTETVSWNRGNERLTYGMAVLAEKSRMSVQQPNPLERNLAISNVNRDDEGLYICTAGAYTVYRVRLRVMYLRILNEGSTEPALNIFEFTNVTLICKTEGYPEPEVSWYRQYDFMNITDLGVTENTLTIVNITRYETGTYIFKASNTWGTSMRYVNVTVNFYPEVAVYQKVIYALLSEEVLMTCEVQGQPLTSFYWESNYFRRIDKSTWQYEFQVDHDIGHPVTYLMTLKIRRNTWNVMAYGNYTCVAFGSGKTATATTVLERMEMLEGHESTDIPQTTDKWELTSKSSTTNMQADVDIPNGDESFPVAGAIAISSVVIIVGFVIIVILVRRKRSPRVRCRFCPYLC